MKRLAIVGSHPGTRDQIPWDEEGLDIWTINEAATHKDTWVKRCTGIFQMHPRFIWDNKNNRNDAKHGEWLKENKTVEVFMLEKFADVPMATKYPLDEITARYLGNLDVHSHRSRSVFYTTTAAYMIALAAYREYDEVDFYGVELSVESEYRYQRPGAMFWLGILTQHANVRFFGQMFDAPIYGYEADGAVDRGVIASRIAGLEPRHAEEVVKTDAANVIFANAFNRFRETGVDHAAIPAALQALTAQINTMSVVSGALQELQRRLKLLDDMVEIDGEFRFSHHEFERDASAIEKEREKQSLETARMSGMIDLAFTLAIENRLHDSRRKGFIKYIDGVLPEYTKAMQKVGIFTGAIAENKLLANVVKEQMLDVHD